MLYSLSCEPMKAALMQWSQFYIYASGGNLGKILSDLREFVLLLSWCCLAENVLHIQLNLGDLNNDLL